MSQFEEYLRAQELSVPEKMQIAVWGQRHDVAGLEAKERKRVLLSQFSILQRLLVEQKKHPLRVFREGLWEDYDEGLYRHLAQMSDEELYQSARGGLPHEQSRAGSFFLTRKIFPNGIAAETLERWTHPQRRVLTTIGAARLLWNLGILPRLYAAENREAFERAQEAFSGSTGPEFYVDHVDREIGTLGRILQNQLLTPNRDPIILLYGAAHDFEKYQLPQLKITQENLAW